MNERIRDLQIQAFAECKTFEGDKVKVRTDEVFERFAELIVRECADLAYKTSWDDLLQGHCQAVLPLHLYNTIKQHFGVEESKGWVCPRCGVDRTKTVCPQGYTATIEGKCPMIGVAQ